MAFRISAERDKGSFYDAKKEDASAYGGRICRESYRNSPFVDVVQENGHFRGDREYDLKGLPKGCKNVGGSDGIGTKVIIADAAKRYSTMAYDLVAMTADDQARHGNLPLVFQNVIDVKSVNGEAAEAAYRELMDGLAKVAREQALVILTGETAQLSACVSGEDPDATLAFNWSGSLHGVSHPDMRITGEKIAAGDYVVALAQDGFRSNGISKVRQAFRLKYGEQWYKTAPREELEAALAPSVPYAQLISTANGWFTEGQKNVDIHGIAHLSGGSFKSKFFEPMLANRGLSAKLDNLFPIPKIATKCAQWLQEGGQTMDEETMYTTWCCGQGMLVVVPDEQNALNLVALAQRHEIWTRIAGRITETPKHGVPSLEIG